MLRTLALSASTLVLLSAFPALAEEKAPFTDAQKAAIEQIARDVIMKSGGDIMQSVQNFQMESQRQAEAASVKTWEDAKQKVYTDKNVYPRIGPDDAKVKVVEFLDYNCGFCKKAFDVVQGVIDTEKDVQVIFVELPILSPQSRTAAEYAMAANMQGKYWEFHQALMNHTGPKDATFLETTAKDLGLDVEKLKKDAASEEVKKALSDKQELAQKLNIQGTPGFIIGNEFVRGYVDLQQMKSQISSVRDQAS